MTAFCTNCGTALNPGAKFCHSCGVATGEPSTTPAVRSPALIWIPTIIAVLAMAALVAVLITSSKTAPQGEAVPLSASRGSAPDLSTMSPEEQATRLFNRVMRLWSEGKTDSAAFFAPMAIGAIEAIGPLDDHHRYDLGMVALATGNAEMAQAQADTILKSRPTHLLALSLAARVADASKNAAAATAFRKRIVAAENSELKSGLPEYSLHENDVKEALRLAKAR